MNNNKFKLALYKVIAPLTFSIVISNIAYSNGLLQVYQMAAKKDPQLQQAFANFKSVEQNIPIAVANLLPEVTLNAGISYDKFLDFDSVISGNNPDIKSNYFSVNLTQPLFYWDRISRYLQSEIEVEKSIHDLEIAKEDLLTRVVEAYFNVLQAEDRLEFVSTEKKSVKQLYREAVERFDVGLIPIADVDEAKARYDLTTADEIDATNQVLARYDELMEIVGQKIDHLSILTPQFKPSSPKPTEVIKWLNLATERNHTYISQKLNRSIVEKNEDIAFAGHLPYAQATGQYRGVKSSDSLQVDDVSSAKGYLSSYGGAIEGGIEIFGGGGTQASVEQAGYNTLAEDYNTERVRRETISNTSQTYRNVMTSINQISALEQAVVSSLSALEATKASYEVGTRASIDVLDRLTELYERKQRLSEARYNYIRNVIELKRLAGVLTNKDIITIDAWLIAKRESAKKLDNSDVKYEVLQTIEKIDQKNYKNLTKDKTTSTKEEKTEPKLDTAKSSEKTKKEPESATTELPVQTKPDPIKTLDEKLNQLEAEQTPNEITEPKKDSSKPEEATQKPTDKPINESTDVIDTGETYESEESTEPNSNQQSDLPYATKSTEDKTLKNLEHELLKSIDKDYKKSISNDKQQDNQIKKSDDSSNKKSVEVNTNTETKTKKYLEPVENTPQRNDAPYSKNEQQDKVLEKIEEELMRIIDEGELDKKN